MNQHSQIKDASSRFCISLLKKLDSLYPDQRRKLERELGLKNGIFHRV
ncbi:MAG: hypothetical protein ACI4CA_00320 [Bacteroides sp.]